MRVTLSTLVFSVTCASATIADDIWISIGTDGYQSLKDHYPAYILEESQSGNSLMSSSTPNVELIKVNEALLSDISQLMHHEHDRCGGFIAHDSLSSAQTELVQNQSLMSQAALVSYSLNNAAVVGQLQQAMSEPGIRNTITDLQTFTNRYYTSTHGVDSAHWLKDEWTQLADGRSDISVSLYEHSWAQPSVVMTIDGRTNPDEIVVLGAHLDSIISGGMSNDTRAPGADDDASGIATLTELIRAITTTEFKPNRTITLIGYAAEEVGLRGSKAIAEDYRSAGKNVVGVLQLDMTNYQGSSQDIYIIDDYTNAAQNEFVEDLVTTYQPGLTVDRSTCGYACSDHASWTNQGYPASFPFEATFSGANPYIHSSGDTLNKSGNNAFHALKFGKLAAAYVGELAKGNMNDTPPEPEPDTDITETFTGSVGRNIEARFGPLNAAADSTVSVVMTGSNDADLYVRLGAEPTTSDWDCRPYESGSSEQCTLSIGSTATDVYLMARGYSQATSNVSIEATYLPADDAPPPPSTVTENFSDSVSRNQEKNYGPFSISAGSRFMVELTGNNDADLYVRFGTPPTSSNYDCRPYQSGSNESCDLTADSTESSAYIMIRGYSANTSDYDLAVDYFQQP